jgi:hypothetical protein
MAMAEPDTEDADSEESYEQRPWLNIAPTSRIRGQVVDVFTPQGIDNDEAQTDSSYGIVLRNPEAVVGELFVNEAKPDGDLTREQVDDDSSNPTDYRLIDPDDSEATFSRDGSLKTGEESTIDGETANTYEEGSIEEDEVLLWVSGLAADRIVRSLDFNGRPYARDTENGPVYGLFQKHEDWESGADFGELASQGKAPRLARPPILRPDYDASDNEDASSVLIDLTREGRGYRGHVFDAEAFIEETGSVDTPTDELPTGRYGIEMDARLDYRQADWDEAREVIEAQDWDPMSMAYEGDGWGSFNAESYGTGSGDGGSDSMTVSTSTVDDDSQNDGSGSGQSTAPTGDGEQDTVAVEAIVEAMRSNEDLHGLTPQEALDGGVSGFIESNASEWMEPPTGDRRDDIERRIYEEISWLDVDELE